MMLRSTTRQKPGRPSFATCTDLSPKMDLPIVVPLRPWSTNCTMPSTRVSSTVAPAMIAARRKLGCVTKP